MKYIFSLGSLGLIAVVPLLASAATYNYVTSSGFTAEVEAPNAETALVTAQNIASNSGVAVDTGLIEPGTPVPSIAGGNAAGGVRVDGSASTYFFVNDAGVTDSVVAANADTALVIAPNIASNSGVAIDRGLLEEGMVVESAR
jgi:hypothetical protein